MTQQLFGSLEHSTPVWVREGVGTKQFPWMKCFATDWESVKWWWMVSLLALTSSTRKGAKSWATPVMSTLCPVAVVFVFSVRQMESPMPISAFVGELLILQHWKRWWSHHNFQHFWRVLNTIALMEQSIGQSNWNEGLENVLHCAHCLNFVKCAKLTNLCHCVCLCA